MPESKNRELTKYGFISHMEAYLRGLLANYKAQPDDYLKSHGIDGPKALNLLLHREDPNDENSAILKRTERIAPEKLEIGDDRRPKDKFHIKYSIVKKDYWKKMGNIYDKIKKEERLDESEDYSRPLSSTPKLFDGAKVVSQCIPGTTGDRFCDYVNGNKNNYAPKMFKDEEKMANDIIDMDYDGAYRNRGGLNKRLNEDGEGGACSCSSAMQGGGSNPDSGQYVQPVSKDVIKRKTIYITEEQERYLNEEAELDTMFGDFGYDAPAFGDDETLDHKNIMAKSWNGGKGE